MRSYRFLATLGLIVISAPSFGRSFLPGSEPSAVVGRPNPGAEPVSEHIMLSRIEAQRRWAQLISPEFRETFGMKPTQETLQSSREILTSMAFKIATDHMKMVLFASRKVLPRVAHDLESSREWFAKNTTPTSQVVVASQAHPVNLAGPIVTDSNPQQSLLAGGSQVATVSVKPDPKPEVKMEIKKDEFLEYSEAFAPLIPVYGAASEMLSQESLASDHQRGWKVSYTSDDTHVPTLTWVGADTPTSTPLLSRNSLYILEKMHGSPLNARKGIVFGQIAAGWDVELFGTYSQPILMTLDHQRIQTRTSASPDFLDLRESNENLYFAFVDVEPDFYIVSFKYRGVQGRKVQGAVSALVQTGRATYLDLTDIRSAPVDGQVVTAKKSRAVFAPDTIVRVVGQEDAATLTGENGEFHFDSVITVANHPVYFETDGKSIDSSEEGARTSREYTQRTRVFSSEFGSVRLRRFPARKIDSVLAQLPNLSLENSNIIIGDASHLVGRLPHDTLLAPSVGTPAGSATPGPRLQTETFVPRPGDRELLTGSDARLSDYKTWFLSLPVPKGPTLVSIRDEHDQNTVSTLLPSGFVGEQNRSTVLYHMDF